MDGIVLIGGGGHAGVVADSIEKGGVFKIEGIVDSALEIGSMCRGYKIIGNDDDLCKIFDSGIKYAFVCIGYMGKGELREKLFKKLTDIGFTIPVITDPTAVVAKSASVGEGTYVGKLAVINAGAVVGRMAIINTNSVVEHDSYVGDYSHISVSASLCGGVHIGKSCLIGAGATLIQGINVGNRAVVGAGSVVVRDIEDETTVVGVPAHLIK